VEKSLIRIPILFLFLVYGTHLHAQSKGSVTGKLTDAGNGEPLMFANVTIEGTAIGSVTDDEGNYRISNLDAGNYVLVFSYLSYETQQHQITIRAGQETRVDGSLKMESIMGEEIVVTGMLRGQSAAINKQIKSNTIVNVVSKDKILELPDQNAAETVARLPGVSVVRDGGEGSKVVLRGIAPRLNSITIDGERIPATDAQDRSVDLSMFSTDALSGIEYYKALRPDMDADAIGGQINFISRKATGGFHGNARIQTGYNHLRKEFGQYKGVLLLENRFFNDKLGLIIGGSVQRANRGAEGYTADWSTEMGVDSEGNQIFTVAKLNVTDVEEIRHRYNANLTADFKLPGGEILFTSNFGQTNRDDIRRRRRYRVDAAYQEYDLRDRESRNIVFTNRLSGIHQLFNQITLDWAASYSTTTNFRPFSHTMRFREIGAFNVNPERSFDDIVNGAKDLVDETWLKDVYFDTYDVRDDNLTLMINITQPFRLANNITGSVKAGGKYRQKNRDYDVNRIWTGHFVGQAILAEGREDPEWDVYYPRDWILMSSFIGDYNNTDFGRFFDKTYYMGPGPDPVNGPHLETDKMEKFRNDYADYYVVYPLMDASDYYAGEEVTAGFLMAELNFADRLHLLGGIRFEETKNHYESIFGTPRVDEDGNVINQTGLVDTVGSRVHDQWLPMFHFKFNLTRWADIRFAATKSLSRPNFFSLVPWERINPGEGIAERGEPNLKQMTAWNYDVILSFYEKFGLFTIGAFYKDIDNIDYTLTSRVFDRDSPINGLNLTRPVNADRTSTILGFEIDLQSNFRFLPSPLDGIVISANYTHLKSETFYPISLIETLPVFPWTSTVKDTIRSGRMPGQVDDLLNLSIGYEKKGFSARISLIYQGPSLFTSGETDAGSLAQSVGIIPELDQIVGASSRWDLSVKQKITKNFEVYLNINNLTNTKETSYLAGSFNILPTSVFVYGLTADIGISYKF
jgi:TonB-dependent receptor